MQEFTHEFFHPCNIFSYEMIVTELPDGCNCTRDRKNTTSLYGFSHLPIDLLNDCKIKRTFENVLRVV